MDLTSWDLNFISCRKLLEGAAGNVHGFLCYTELSSNHDSCLLHRNLIDAGSVFTNAYCRLILCLIIVFLMFV